MMDIQHAGERQAEVRRLTDMEIAARAEGLVAKWEQSLQDRGADSYFTPQGYKFYRQRSSFERVWDWFMGEQ